MAMGAQQLEIHDQQVHLRIAHTLSYPESGRVHAVHARLDGRETVDQAHATITMAMPIDFHIVLLDDFLLDELHQGPDAVRRGMPDRVSQADALRPAVDCGPIQRFEGLGPGPRRVLGDVHDWQAMLYGIGHGFFARLQDAVESPVLGVLPDGRRADERRRFDLDADLVGDPDDRLDVGHDGARGAVGEDGQLLITDLRRQGADLIYHPRAGTR